METIKYKFNIGDTVQFKNKFHPTASCGLKTLAGRIVKVVDQRYYGRPCYKFEGLEEDGWFTEGCVTPVTSNPYVVSVGDTKDDLYPYLSTPTKKTAVEKAKELTAKYCCVEATYMPEDNDDINEIVYSNYVEGK